LSDSILFKVSLRVMIELIFIEILRCVDMYTNIRDCYSKLTWGLDIKITPKLPVPSARLVCANHSCVDFGYISFM
jgi:hypothetical protein